MTPRQRSNPLTCSSTTEGLSGQALVQASTATPSCAASSAAIRTASTCTQWARTRIASARNRFSRVTLIGEASRMSPRCQPLKVEEIPRVLPLPSPPGLEGNSITSKGRTSLQHLSPSLPALLPPRQLVLLLLLPPQRRTALPPP